MQIKISNKIVINHTIEDTTGEPHEIKLVFKKPHKEEINYTEQRKFLEKVKSESIDEDDLTYYNVFLHNIRTSLIEVEGFEDELGNPVDVKIEEVQKAVFDYCWDIPELSEKISVAMTGIEIKNSKTGATE